MILNTHERVSILEIAVEVYKHSPLLRPVRALVLAYSYVLTGKKVETPYEWNEI